ncbi:hypothetical protein AGDE_10990 [Angomonas deanei]|nr:hypothetical protein AGDE_10990 [Angomonas deanei]|eukprot:EPY26991.1 hypothetical protein AGDE_10990 [Angomonas deanei]
MKMSIKFTADIHAQRTEAEGTFSDVEFTLVGSLEGPECREMRAFMPYLLRDGRTELLEDYIGMSQRLTDSCFPPLGEWTEEEHHENFGIVCDRLKRLDLLGAMGHFQPSWLEQLTERFRSNANNKKKRDAGNSNDNQEQQASTEGDLIVMLAVDFFFDTPTCPIFVTSAKVRLFESKSGLSPPYLREADEEEEPAETEETKSNATEVEEETIVRFFRLFRDEVNWNRYLDEVHKRKNAALGEENKPDGAAWKRYFVFASEFSDLVQTGEAFDRMGLPLEFRQPELLANNPELAAVVKEIMENMNKQKIYL